jgi:hypothetical protein
MEWAFPLAPAWGREGRGLGHTVFPSRKKFWRRSSATALELLSTRAHASAIRTGSPSAASSKSSSLFAPGTDLLRRHWLIFFSAKGAQTRMSSGLGNFPAHAPSFRSQHERPILAIPKQALAHAAFELLAAILRKRQDVSAPRPRAFRKRLPIVVK